MSKRGAFTNKSPFENDSVAPENLGGVMRVPEEKQWIENPMIWYGAAVIIFTIISLFKGSDPGPGSS